MANQSLGRTQGPLSNIIYNGLDFRSLLNIRLAVEALLPLPSAPQPPHIARTESLHAGIGGEAQAPIGFPAQADALALVPAHGIAFGGPMEAGRGRGGEVLPAVEEVQGQRRGIRGGEAQRAQAGRGDGAVG